MMNTFQNSYILYLDGLVNTVCGKRKSVYGKIRAEVGEKITKALAEIQLGIYIGKNNDTLYEIINNHISQRYEDGIVSGR